MIDFEQVLHEQIEFSFETFGPQSYSNADGLVDHITKELEEIKKDPSDLMEWIDIAILAFDGAWRCTDASPNDIIWAYIQKMEINKQRKWPDWRTATPGKAIEHVRDNE